MSRDSCVRCVRFAPSVSRGDRRGAAPKAQAGASCRPATGIAPGRPIVLRSNVTFRIEM